MTTALENNLSCIVNELREELAKQSALTAHYKGELRKTNDAIKRAGYRVHIPVDPDDPVWHLVPLA